MENFEGFEKQEDFEYQEVGKDYSKLLNLFKDGWKVVCLDAPEFGNLGWAEQCVLGDLREPSDTFILRKKLEAKEAS